MPIGTTGYGWAYVAQDFVTAAGGPLTSLQFKTGDNDISGSSTLIYDYTNTTLILSGTLNVSGAINANSFNTNVTSKTVINLSATGSTNLGDSADDTHVVTGTLLISGASNPINVQGLQDETLSGARFVGLNASNNLVTSVAPVSALNNQAANRLVTIGSTTTELDGESNLTFDGTTLNLTGLMSASVAVSSSLGRFTTVTSSNFTDGTLQISNGNITSAEQIGATGLTGTLGTAAQPNITSLGNLTGLTVDSTTLVVNGTSNKVGIGRTSPDKTLEVVDNSAEQLRITHTAGSKFVDFQATSDGFLYINPSHNRVGIETNVPTAPLAVSGATHISGNVGIFTTTPEEALDVHGNARITGDLVVSGTLNARVTDFVITANTLTFGDSATDTITFNAATASTPNGLNIDSNTLVVDASNNRIGIGTPTPDYHLDVAGNIGLNEYIYHNGDDDTLIRFQDDDIDIQVGGKSMINIDEDTNSKILLGKDTNNLNVGIRTSNPQANLHVSGSAIVTDDLAVTGSITGSAFTNGTVVIASNNNVSGIATLTATNLAGTLTTAAQTNITSVGNLSDLTVDSTTFKVNSTSNKVGIGRTAPAKKLEIVDNSAAQLRLSDTADSKFADLRATSDGYLLLSPSHNNVGIGTTRPTANLAISGNIHVSASTNPIRFDGVQLAQTTTSSFLALDANNNLILTSSGTVVTVFVSASILNYTNPSDNRLITSVNSDSVNAEENLTFDGSVLNVTGHLTASTGVSSSLGQFANVIGASITDGTATMASGQLTSLTKLSGSQTRISSLDLTSSNAVITQLTTTGVTGTLATAAQPNITSVGNLTSLTADSTTFVVKATTSRVGIGRTGPQRKLDVFDGGGDPQVRVSFDASNFAELQTTSDGILQITSSGGQIAVGNLSASVNISASAYFGDGSNLTGINAGIAYARTAVTGTLTSSVSDVLLGVSASSALQIRLPAASGYTAGQYFTVKDEAGNANNFNITILTTGADKIDGESSIILESPFAAVNIYSDGSSKFFVY